MTNFWNLNFKSSQQQQQPQASLQVIHTIYNDNAPKCYYLQRKKERKKKNSN